MNNRRFAVFWVDDDGERRTSFVLATCAEAAEELVIDHELDYNEGANAMEPDHLHRLVQEMQERSIQDGDAWDYIEGLDDEED